MLLTPIYIAMTFLKSWRIKTFKTRLLEFLSGGTSVAFLKIPDNICESPTLSSRLCLEQDDALICDYADYSTHTRICSMKPPQTIDLKDWITVKGCLPLGVRTNTNERKDCRGEDLNILLECNLEQYNQSAMELQIKEMGETVAWKADLHLALILRTDIERLSMIGANYVLGDLVIEHNLPIVRIQTVQITGKPSDANDTASKVLIKEISKNFENTIPPQLWHQQVNILRKLSRVNMESNESQYLNVNGHSMGAYLSASNLDLTRDLSVSRENSVTTTATLDINNLKCNDEKSNRDEQNIETTTFKDNEAQTVSERQVELEKEIESSMHPNVVDFQMEPCQSNSITIEIKQTITPKKSLKLDLKKSLDNLQTKSASLLNMSSQVKSITKHKRIMAPKKKTSHTSETSLDKPKEDTVKQSEDAVKQSQNVQINTQDTIEHKHVIGTEIRSKSPNVIIYSDSVVARDNLKETLKKVLHPDRYTIHTLTDSEFESGVWVGKSAFIGVVGNVPPRGPHLIRAALRLGTPVLALCSNLLNALLPQYATAEVRENELVQFTYNRWRSIKMKHHIFCYQASPVKKQFSTENDKNKCTEEPRPGSGDGMGDIDVEILASEHTWQTPSLLRANFTQFNSIALFSQIHLETDPRSYLGPEAADIETARIEIAKHILSEILGLDVISSNESDGGPNYTVGYFLGNHVEKMSLVNRLTDANKSEVTSNGVKLVWFSSRSEDVGGASATYLPLSIHECPPNFDTRAYFTNLTSTHVGRLVIYSDILTSTQKILNGRIFEHGLGVIARRQTEGVGRHGNKWLSPEGCAMMSVQLHMKNRGEFSVRVASLAQLAAALAAVRAIAHNAQYQGLNVRIKWPNDIYFGDKVKLGGVVANATFMGDDIILNIGLGININNSIPTLCINDLIRQYNAEHNTKLPQITLEDYLAHYSSQMERIFSYLTEESGVEAFLEQYYIYWLHDFMPVRIQTSPGIVEEGKIIGVDEYGYLRVRCENGELVTVQPDDNTFDMLSGLIAPKSKKT